jgi:hypothetical protein
MPFLVVKDIAVAEQLVPAALPVVLAPTSLATDIEQPAEPRSLVVEANASQVCLGLR